MARGAGGDCVPARGRVLAVSWRYFVSLEPSGCKNSLYPRAGGNRPNNSRLFGRFPTPAVARGALFRSPAGISIDFAYAKRLKSLFRRAGDRLGNKLKLASGRPGPAYAAEAVPSGTRYWPAGREKPSPSARQRNLIQTQKMRLNDFATLGAARGILRELPCAGGGPTKAKRTPAKHPTGAPGGRCLPAPGIGHSGEKTVFVRALAEIDQTTLGCLVDFLLQQSRAGFLAAFCDANPAKGGRPLGFHLDCARAQRAKSLLMRAGCRSAREPGCVYPKGCAP